MTSGVYIYTLMFLVVCEVLLDVCSQISVTSGVFMYKLSYNLCMKIVWVFEHNRTQDAHVRFAQTL